MICIEHIFSNKMEFDHCNFFNVVRSTDAIKDGDHLPMDIKLLLTDGTFWKNLEC